LNPLGVAAVEAPGLKPYLDAVCRFFYGDGLELPSVPSYWCGDPSSLRYVKDHVDELVFKSSMQERTGPLIRPAPLIDAGKLSYGRIALRTFLCRRGDDYLVMPGGMARANAPPDGLFLTGEDEGLSKDVWIPSGTQMTNRPPPAMPEGRIELKRGGVELPSRLIDDLYWLGRYTERGDMTARLLRCAYERVGSEAADDAPLAIDRILDALQALEILPKASRPPENDLALAQALGEPTQPTSLCGLMHSVHLLSQR